MLNGTFGLAEGGMKRGAGILMPISALPSKYGVGSLGKNAFAFVDFLKAAGQKYWQVLPLVQTGYGDSPYQTCCDASGNPYFLDLEILHAEGLITKRELAAAIDKSPLIDYGKLYAERYALLRKAFSRFDVDCAPFTRWRKNRKYADYACFMALKQKFNAPFMLWPDEYKYRDPAAITAFMKGCAEEIMFWQFLQYEFSLQWRSLKTYANKKGIKIIGDLPLYVAPDSVDVWLYPELFMLDGELRPKKVAGVPPDYFSADGQLWGNPVYNYPAHAADGYIWWKNRLKRALSTYDYVRVDHFRGLDRFWAVDAAADTAREGEWLPSPGDEIFSGIDVKRVIAEDLGTIDDGVRELIKKTGVPNMKVLEFAFGGDKSNPYLPWNIGENCVYYTGTHDNDTVVGFLKSTDAEFLKAVYRETAECLDYLGIRKDVKGVYDLADAFTDIVYASRANVAIIPMHDILSLGSEFRINTPGTMGNWRVRYRKRLFTDVAAEMALRKVRRYNR